MADNDLFWIDLETTGLNPHMDRVLEVAVYRSKMTVPFVAQKLYEAVLHFDQAAPSAPHVDPYVAKMHDAGKLWSACSASKLTYAQVVAALASIIPVVEDPAARPILAGSTIHFDRDFIRQQFDPIEPLSTRFHHRHYDVSAIRLFCESLGMPKIPKGEAHRASLDVEESIAHAVKCAEWIASSRTAPLLHPAGRCTAQVDGVRCVLIPEHHGDHLLVVDGRR
jgi:oligoribonuclease